MNDEDPSEANRPPLTVRTLMKSLRNTLSESTVAKLSIAKPS